MCEKRLEGELFFDPLVMVGSKVWVYFKDSSPQGWDFGPPGLSPTPLFKAPERPQLEFIDGTKWWNTGPSRIWDRVTNREVFKLSGRYAKPTATRWDSQYLVAGYSSGEVLILDFNSVLLQ